MKSKIKENLRDKFYKLTHSSRHKNESIFDVDENQSNINVYLTDDVLEIIFFNVNNQDLTANVCLVCKRWYNIIGNDLFWKRKYILKHSNYQTNENNINNLFKLKQFNMLVDKNYLKNPYGDENLNNWHCAKNLNKFKYLNRKHIKHLIHNYKHNRQTPYGWTIVNDKNSNEQMDRLNNFFTGFLVCEKLQIIDFKNEKKQIKSLLNQNVTIKLRINEFYSTVKNKYSLYNLKVLIIDDDFRVIDRFFYSDQLDGSGDSSKLWKQVEHSFIVKQPFRYMIYYHAGQDQQFFLGFYGTRITNGSIKFLF
jgi:hypothetical protein